LSQNESLSTYWWNEDRNKVHEILFGILRFLDQNQKYIEERNKRAWRLYGNVNTLGLSSHSYMRESGQSSQTDRVTLNIVQSMCDTVTQKIAKNKPRPMFLTEEGDREMRNKADLLNKFVEGQFYATNIYGESPKVFRDSTIFGTGALKIYRQGSEIKCERTFIDEIKVDEVEARYGTPRSMYQVKYMPKEVMVRLFPTYTQQILSCKNAEESYASHASLSNLVQVCEAWHLPSDKKANDGRHVICIENVTLEDEKYKKDYFPFVFSRWSERLLGFYGQGLAEQLTGLQIEISKILKTIQMAFHLNVPKMMVEANSKVVLNHLNNQEGGIVRFFGTKPEWVHFQSVNPQTFEHLERLYSKAYEIAGVSQLAASSKKPAGLDSGKALRVFDDIDSERFILAGQAFEQFHLDAGKQFIDLGKEIFEEEGKYEITAQTKKFIKKINWKDIDLSDDQYVMKCFPVSMLSKTPAGKLQDVQDLIQAGFIDKAHALELLDMPDLEAYTSRATAPLKDIEQMIDNMLDKGIYEAPEPYQDLQNGMPEVLSAYLKAKNDKVPEERLELLRRWMEQAQSTMNPPAPSQPPQPSMGEGQPQGQMAPSSNPGLPQGSPTAVPEAPPTSALLPSAPGGMQ